MKQTLLSFIFVVVVLLAPNAQGLTQDWGGAEDDWAGPTLKGPTATVCYAMASNQQNCRACKKQYDDFGKETPLGVVCAYVEYKASCYCTYPNGGKDCQAHGYCEYFQ